MALGATVRRFEVTLSDVDRGVYESIELRVAQHPSENERWLVTRLFAYCLAYEEGIAFSKGGLSDTDEPPVLVRDAGGRLVAWIDVGQPAAERLHKARKLVDRVALYTTAAPDALRREMATRRVHALETIEAFRLDAALVDAVAAKLDRSLALEIARSDGRVYVTIDGVVTEGAVDRFSLATEG